MKAFAASQLNEVRFFKESWKNMTKRTDFFYAKNLSVLGAIAVLLFFGGINMAFAMEKNPGPPNLNCDSGSFQLEIANNTITVQSLSFSVSNTVSYNQAERFRTLTGVDVGQIGGLSVGVDFPRYCRHFAKDESIFYCDLPSIVNPTVNLLDKDGKIIKAISSGASYDTSFFIDQDLRGLHVKLLILDRLFPDPQFISLGSGTLTSFEPGKPPCK